MKYFVFSDVHGFYTILKNALDKAGFDENNDNHMLISLGDIFDRGKEPLQMLEFFKKMVDKKKILMVKGNHEDLFMEVLKNQGFKNRDYHNQTYDTFCDLATYLNPKEGINTFYDEPHKFYEQLEGLGIFELFSEMKDYLEIGNYIFVHGYIPTLDNRKTGEKSYNPNWREEKDWFWARWNNGMECADELDIHEGDKTIVCGHFHSSYGNARKLIKDLYPKQSLTFTKYNFEKYEFADEIFSADEKERLGMKSIYDIYYGNHVIAIDACTAYTKQMNIFTFEIDENNINK